MTGLRLARDDDALSVSHGEQELLRYVYRPTEAQLESPRPYFHPLRTLAGECVSLYRPHDHVWHKGIAWSLPNVGSENFWGGPTYVRNHGYVQLPNNGATRHRDFPVLHADDHVVSVTEQLDWVTEAGSTWFTERRTFAVTVDNHAWTLTFATRFTNISDARVVMGSPTTEGRDNAGYGGLFWRGPRSFSGGRVYVPNRIGADDLMGVRAPWLAFTGQHDGTGRRSTLVFVDAPDNLGHPTQWFVRSEMFACVCPAPFFSTEVPVAPGESLSFRYAVVIADGDPGVDGAAKLADTGSAALATLEQAG